MHRIGKVGQQAIAAVSYLASRGAAFASAAEVASARRLPQPIVGKILSELAQCGLVRSTPGPGGGYTLARPAADITLLDVVSVFDGAEQPLMMCPFGPDWCGHHAPCPLHDSIVAAGAQFDAFLRQQTFGVFVRAQS